MPVYIVFLGPPGAGKGTQASLLAQRMGLPHVATGDILRDAVSRGTELGLRAKGYMDRGELVPNELVVNIVIERLSQPDAGTGAVLDGFPRSMGQAVALEKALAERGAAVNLAIYIEVSEPELVKRLSGRWECRSCGAVYHEVTNPPRAAEVCDRCGSGLSQRSDDRPETVRRRLQVYLEQTAPLLDYYVGKGILAKVDGERPIDDVTAGIAAVVAAKGFGTR